MLFCLALLLWADILTEIILILITYSSHDTSLSPNIYLVPRERNRTVQIINRSLQFPKGNLTWRRRNDLLLIELSLRRWTTNIFIRYLFPNQVALFMSNHGCFMEDIPVASLFELHPERKELQLCINRLNIGIYLELCL